MAVWEREKEYKAETTITKTANYLSRKREKESEKMNTKHEPILFFPIHNFFFCRHFKERMNHNGIIKITLLKFKLEISYLSEIYVYLMRSVQIFILFPYQMDISTRCFFFHFFAEATDPYTILRCLLLLVVFFIALLFSFNLIVFLTTTKRWKKAREAQIIIL